MKTNHTPSPRNIPNLFKDHKIELRSVSDIRHAPNNPRKITDKQKEKAVSLIHETGFIMPIVIDQNGVVIIGGEWLEAALLLELQEIPVILAGQLSEANIRLLRIAYPKIQELGDWDLKILATEFQFFTNMKIDLRATAFDTPEIDMIMLGNSPSTDEIIDSALPDLEASKPAVYQINDLWLLDQHRLLCGSAMDQNSYKILMDGKSAQAIISDPPFNVPNKGHTGGKGSIKHREFVEAHGEKTEDEFIDFLAGYLTFSSSILAEGGLIYSFMDWRHQYEMIISIRRSLLKQINLVFWNKTNGAMGSLYRSKHELVYVLKKDTDSHINNVELGKHGRYRTNVWDYAGINTFRKGRMDELSMHPTVKPVAMIADAIMDCTKHGQIILDPFMGSGTIFIACEKTGRRGYGIDLDPLYVDTAIRRWQTHTGKQAIHAGSGLTFVDHEQGRHQVADAQR